MTPPRILFVSTSMGLGGADKQVSLLAGELDQRGYDIHVLSLRPVGRMGKELQEKGVSVTSLNADSAIEAPIILNRFRRVVKNFQPDIIHSHMFHANILSRIVRTLAPVDAVLSTIHNIYESSPQNGELQEVTWRERMYRVTDFLSEMSTCVSRSGMQRHVEVGAVSRQKAKAVYNGIDLDNFHSDAETRKRMRKKKDLEDEFVWLSVGRLTAQKDYPTLFQAIENRKGSHKLLIIGKGEKEEELKQEVVSRNLEETVEFLGTVDSVRKYMNAADGFVLPSHWEGFGIAIIEAMACELPVVATRSGGPTEIIEHEKTGLLVPPRTPDKLGEAMRQIMDLKERERVHMGSAARASVIDNFSIENIVEVWCSIYDDLNKN